MLRANALFRYSARSCSYIRSLCTVSAVPADSWHSIHTPAVVIDKNVLNDNILNMQRIANNHSVSLRPHVKTHKCLEIARLQVKHGAVGVTCSTPGEALVFIKEGIDTFIAYPIVSTSKLCDLFINVSKYSNFESFSMIVDSLHGVHVLIQSLTEFEFDVQNAHKLHVLIKINVGLNRCGVNTECEMHEIMDLIEEYNKNELRGNKNFHIVIDGICSHAGHAYNAATSVECNQISTDETNLMRKYIELFDKRIKYSASNNGKSALSVGCTLTELARTDYCRVSEIRPGNYVFMDLTPLRIGLIERHDISLSILATVISMNEKYALVDCGSKTISSDLGAHGSGNVRTYGEVYPIPGINSPNLTYGSADIGVMLSNSLKNIIHDNVNQNDPLSAHYELTKLSEEHGWISLRDKPIGSLSIGQKVLIIPNHSCPVVNLAEQMHVYELDSNQRLVFETWRVQKNIKIRSV